MTVGELKKLLAQHEEDTECIIFAETGAWIQFVPLAPPEPYLYDGQDTFDFDESKIDPGHLQKVLVF